MNIRIRRYGACPPQLLAAHDRYARIRRVPSRLEGSHTRALLRGGSTAYLHADLRNVDDILERPIHLKSAAEVELANGAFTASW